ncbi:unnamed protein product [Urochloa decumbens]|uniref:UBC core domain-containing protein n=1 Tax=Urochloa decumbens TaxID=240449 RepID=A0ABC8VY25_9POAL
MQDATGQTIFLYDLVMFQTTGAHLDRGLAVRTLPGNKLIVVELVDGTEVAKKPCDLTVVDRFTMFPGTTVASASDRGGQAGVVTGVATALDLVRLDGGGDEPMVVATGVSPAEVRPVLELTLGDYVVSGTWLGRVVEVSVDVDVLFDDGSACRVTKAGDKQLRVVGKRILGNHDKKNAFCPGDRVAGDASVFNASRWLSGHWKPSRTEGTVAKVETGGVLVYWVASQNAAVSAPPPAYQPNPRSLTFFCAGDAILRFFWAVSDRCFFRREPSDDSCRAGGVKKKKRRQRAGWGRAKLPEFSVRGPMAVADTHTLVDVLWQDGTRQRGVPSASLVRTDVRNEQDLFPGQRVVGRTLAPADDAIGAAGRVGVVKSLNYKDQTACVSWNTAGESSEAVDTVMSTYDLTRSSDHRFFYGNMVVRLQPTVNEETAASVQGSNDLSWVGHIVDLCDAQYVHVKWGDGTTSKVLLHEIAIVKPRTIDEMIQEMGDWVHDDEVDNDASDDKALEDTIDSRTPDSEGGPVGGTTIIGKVGYIIQKVIRTLSGMLLAQGKMQMLSWSMALASRPEPAITEKIRTCSPRISDGGDCHVEEAAAVDEVFHFKHFDIVQSPQDHHYLDNKEQGCGGGRKWLKRVQTEWKILETSLPDAIYVRAFEDRMDLLRAVIVGANGTPYHDGLFFFDLQLPPSYPTTPPLVKYHSFGFRANPNLYPSGTVCLSLLNTFGGKGAELWSPEMSSVLQVVISIQGLVLTAQPYYNETGYEAQVGKPEGQRNEMPYSENTYLVNLNTMLHLIRRPLMGFEGFIRDHFHRRGQHILRACEAYQQEGCPVGTLDGEAVATEASKDRSCSVGFRLALAKVMPRLVEAFSGIGAQV